MNTLSFLTISFVASLVLFAMVYTHQPFGRMGLAAIVWLLFGCSGIYAGALELLQAYGQIPTWLWFFYWIIPLYFVGVVAYWLRSLYATWQKWSMFWATIKVWRAAGAPRKEALQHILGALSSQGHHVSPWVASCLFWIVPERRS